MGIQPLAGVIVLKEWWKPKQTLVNILGHTHLVIDLVYIGLG